MSTKNKLSQISSTIVFSDSEDDYDVEPEDIDIVEDEITFRVQEKHDVIIREFREFLNKPEFITPKGDADTNIVDRHSLVNGQIGAKCYNIPDAKIPRFFKYLEICRRRGLMLMMYEKQLEYSGIMIDFDIMQKNDKSRIDDRLLQRLQSKLIGHLKKYLNLDKPSPPLSDVEAGKGCRKVVIAYIQKPKIVYNEEMKYYKDGFHVLIPGIQVDRATKKFLLDKAIEENIFETVFEDIEPAEGFSSIDFIDKNSAHVPCHFLGNSSKNGCPPYKLVEVYNSYVYYNSPEPDNTIQSCLNEYNDLSNSTVVCHELSINWEKDPLKGGKILKRKYSVKEKYLMDIIQYQNKIILYTEESHEEEHNELSLLKMHDPDADFIKSLLDALHPKRAENYELWFQVICMLANISPSYKPLAIYFSKKCPAKYNPSSFETTWNSVMGEKKGGLSLGSLHHWAKEDNPDRYNEIKHRSMFNIIYKKIYDPQVEGNLQHYDIAEILFKSLHHKYAYDAEAGGVWYEFVIDGEPQKNGEIYKWRKHERSPNSLKRYISEILPVLFQKVLDKIDQVYQASTGDFANYHYSIKKNFQVSCRNLRNNGFKTGVSNESEQLFERIGFSESLDTDPTIMGVGNGLLKLGKKSELITGFHSYLISEYTEINYKPFDPFDPITKQVMCALRNLFPDNEPDTFNFVMHYFASALDGKKKESLLSLLVGSGSNGKSFLIELHKGILSKYGSKQQLSALTSRQKNADGASPSVVALYKKRAAYYSESSKNESLHTAKVKEMTGNENITGRALYGPLISFRPVAIHIVTSNYDFAVEGYDHGIWRRLLKIAMKMKFCKPGIEEYDPNNPYERIADLSLGLEWPEDPKVLTAFLGLMVYYYESLQNNYGGVVESVPHPNIQKTTELFRNGQDKINNFIDSQLVKTVDPDIELPMNTLTEKYIKWFESNYPGAKREAGGLKDDFENSIISKILIKTSKNSYLKGYRILDNTEKPDDGEEYFSSLNIKKNKKIDIVEQYETTDEYYQRICNSFKNKLNIITKPSVPNTLEGIIKDLEPELLNEPIPPSQARVNKSLNKRKDNISEKSYDKNGFEIKEYKKKNDFDDFVSDRESVCSESSNDSSDSESESSNESGSESSNNSD